MPSPVFVPCGDRRIACLAEPGRAPTVVFLGGFRSDMRGTKASTVAGHCAARGLACLRFDYSGHGASSGAFRDATIGQWLHEALAVIDRASEGPLLLIGSSMGGWLATLAALARAERVRALLTVAAAPDMTERLLRPALDANQREALARDGETTLTSEYDPGGYPLTLTLLDEGRRHCVLDRPLAIDAPARLLHGTADRDVPWQLSLELLQRLRGADARLTLVKDADHRFSGPRELALLRQTLDELAA